MRRPLLTPVPFLVALICAAVTPLPASAQAGPPCGSDQLEVDATVSERYAAFREMYATHTYRLGLRFHREPPTRDYLADEENVQVTGPPGVVRRVGGGVELAPQVAGTMPLTVSWEQAAYADDAPPCAAATTVELPVRAPLPVTLAPYRGGTRASFVSWPCGGASTCGGARAFRFGIFFRLAAGERDPEDGYNWHAADLTPVRVEARAVAGAKLPSLAVEPAVLEFAPLARHPRRAKAGLVEIVRRGGEAVEFWVAARPGSYRRSVSFTFTQGARRLGSFAAAGRCSTLRSFGAPSTSCDFKGKHSWLWVPSERRHL